MMGVEGSNGVDWVGVGVGGGSESRRRRVAPRLKDQMVLSISAVVDAGRRSAQSRSETFVVD